MNPPAPVGAVALPSASGPLTTTSARNRADSSPRSSRWITTFCGGASRISRGGGSEAGTARNLPSASKVVPSYTLLPRMSKMRQSGLPATGRAEPAIGNSARSPLPVRRVARPSKWTASSAPSHAVCTWICSRPSLSDTISTKPNPLDHLSPSGLGHGCSVCAVVKWCGGLCDGRRYTNRGSPWVHPETGFKPLAARRHPTW
jgi:hypothetical protein